MRKLFENLKKVEKWFKLLIFVRFLILNVYHVEFKKKTQH